MNIEDRLRAELERTGRTTTVGAAPSVDDLASIADGRHKRNRIAGIGAGVLVAGGVFIGALTYVQSSDSTTEVASEGAATESVEVADPSTDGDDVNSEEENDDSANAIEPAAETATAEEETTTLEAPEVVGDDADDAVDDSVAAIDDDEIDLVAEFGAAQLQADDIEMTVETRESAVGLGSGSGVLVLPSANGYVGLGVAFGNETTAIGISSPNGLDWSSSVLAGVPAGATASVLREHAGTYVALFERFNAESGIKEFSIGTSPDAVAWELSSPLLGAEVFATDLAVGASGVIVIGDNDAPEVWTGPIGGPYERGSRLDATLVSGVTTVDAQFVVAGRNTEGLALFVSTNGVDWTAKALGTNNDGMTVSVNNGTVTLRSVEGGVADTLISSDAGETWSALAASANRGVSASASTVGFLGETSGAVVTIADADSFSTADLDVAAPDRLALVAAGSNEIVMAQTTESGTTWIVVTR